MNADQLSPEMKSIYYGFSETFLRSLLRFQDDQRGKAPRLNAHALILDLSSGRLHGENREALEESARRDGVDFDPLRPYVSFRDLTATSAPGGGYLKQADGRDAADILRAWSVVARAGITVETGLAGDQVVPKVTAKHIAGWLSTESSTSSASAPTLTQISMSPKTVSGLIQYSRQFSKQTNAPAFAGRELLRTVGGLIDVAVLNGSGSNGEPQGLMQNSSVQTMAGASLTGASANQMKQLSADQNAPDELISFTATPTVRRVLEGRERASGSGFIWDNDKISSRPGYVSTAVPASTLICGPWPLVYLGIWGSGFTLEINPYESTNFKSGVIQARVMLSCDVAILHPAAFVVASSVS